MALQTKTYEQFLSDIITSWASALNLSPNLQAGDPLLAIFQSIVLCGLMFIQALCVRIEQLTRAQTSNGADLDSWNAQFSFSRIGAIQATGQVQFAVRNVSSSNILVAAGTVVQTIDGKVQYQVIADANQAAWNAAQNAYVLTAGQLTLSATVQAVVAGSASNVQVGALSVFASTSNGINIVTNLSPIENGADAESDDSYRTRFKAFINAVNARTTPLGYYSAAINTPGVKAVKLVENQDRYGNAQPGYGFLVIDDGSGAPSAALIAAVTAATSLVNSPTRGMCIQSLVIGPTLLTVPITLNVKVDPSYSSPAVLLAAELAVIDYIDALEIGDPLYIDNVAYAAKVPGVIAVQNGSVSINSVNADYLGTPQSVIRTNNAIVTIGTW